MADNFTVVSALPATGCDREDIYNVVRTAVPTTEVVDDVTIGVADGKFFAKPTVPQWKKASFTYADFTVDGAPGAGLTESITAFALAAGQVLLKSVIDVTEAWVISGMSTFALKLGITADLGKYSNDTTVAAATATRGTMFDPQANEGLESMTASTNILLTGTSDAGNLGTATAGAVDIYYLVGSLNNV